MIQNMCYRTLPKSRTRVKYGSVCRPATFGCRAAQTSDTGLLLWSVWWCELMHSISAAAQGHRGLGKKARFSLISLFIWISSSMGILSANAQTGTAPSGGTASPAVMVYGFVGGFVRSDDGRHLEVQMIQRLAKDSAEIRAAVFENRHRAMARQEILHRLDIDGDGRLSESEKRSARIILVGHSWGGSAAIRLAEELNASGIPVLLTIQLDSVNRVTGDDCVIPANVAQALNFYQTRGLVHGCRMVRPMDANRTKILGNLEFEYAAQPAGCSTYSWLTATSSRPTMRWTAIRRSGLRWRGRFRHRSGMCFGSSERVADRAGLAPYGPPCKSEASECLGQDERNRRCGGERWRHPRHSPSWRAGACGARAR